MTQSQKRHSVENAGMEALKDLFGNDVKARIATKELSLQTCIVSGCDRTFWIPYGRYYQEGGNINRGVCSPQCDAAYRRILEERALAAEATFFSRESEVA